MDILTIATREANRAYYTADGGNETKAEAYYNTYRATKRRGRKAEEILAAGAVSPNGKAGSYYVESQNGGGTYTVDLDAGTCTCPDHEHRATFCKHLIAAELSAHNEEDPRGRVVLEVEGYARGRQVLDKRLRRVRVNGGSYREARSQDFDAALDWLQSEGYELTEIAGPGHKMGTATVRYIYQR